MYYIYFPEIIQRLSNLETNHPSLVLAQSARIVLQKFGQVGFANFKNKAGFASCVLEKWRHIMT